MGKSESSLSLATLAKWTRQAPTFQIPFFAGNKVNAGDFFAGGRNLSLQNASAVPCIKKNYVVMPKMSAKRREEMIRGWKSTNRTKISAIDSEINELHGLPKESQQLEGDGSLVGQILSKAVASFVKSQLDECEDLKIQIGGGNTELLTGHIRHVAVRARSVSYNGLAIENALATASKINLGLFEKSKNGSEKSFPIRIKLGITHQDLNRSMSSPLVHSIVRDIFQINGSQPIPSLSLLLEKNLFQIQPKIASKYSPIKGMKLALDLSKGGSILSINSVHENTSNGDDKTLSLNRVFDLGAGTRIQKLDISEHGLDIVGDFTVYL